MFTRPIYYRAIFPVSANVNLFDTDLTTQKASVWKLYCVFDKKGILKLKRGASTEILNANVALAINQPFSHEFIIFPDHAVNFTYSVSGTCQLLAIVGY